MPYTSITYTYDYAGRRIAKNVDGTITKYVYDGDKVIAEYDSSDTLLRKFIYGPGIDEPICMIIPAGLTNAGTYFYHLDAQGSVIALSQLDTTVKVVEKYTYSAFGQAAVQYAGADKTWGTGDDDTSRIDSALGNPYQFTSRRWDAETGLYYYRARMYDPVLGRFMQTDPIGYYDSMNLYTYCGNNPVNWIDPWGLTTGGDPLNAEDSLVQSGSMNADEAAAMRSRSAGARNWEKFKQFFKNLFKRGKNPEIDANKLNHIFNNARHNLGGLVEQFGSAQKAYNAIYNAVQQAVQLQGINGVFEITVTVGGQVVTVRGNVIDGIVNIGTAFICDGK